MNNLCAILHIPQFVVRPLALVTLGLALPMAVCAQIAAPKAAVVQIDPALLAKANAGDQAAQVAVGEAYATAPGKAQDCKLAADWFEKAADRNNMDAILHLAALARDGCKTLPRDMARAASWYTKAAELGDTTAQGTLGTLYSFGQGVAQSYTEAYFWLDVAAHTAGPRQAQYAANRQLAGAHITADEVDAARERVENWLASHPHPQGR